MDKFERIAIPPTSEQVADAVICHLENDVFQQRQVCVAGAGRERCLPDYVIERDDFPCFILEFVAGGRGTLILRGETFRLLPGHIFLYGPGTPITIRNDPEAPMLKYFIEFFGGDPKKLFHSGIITPGQVRRITEIDQFAGLCEQLIDTGRKNFPQSQAICTAYLNLILIKTTQAVSHGPQSATLLLDHMDRCRNYIEKNFAEIHDLETVSRAVHLDRSYICRLFKQFEMPSPHRYLTACRMNRAVELLLASNLSIKAVAANVGYADPLHFSRNFHRQFDCSPRDFRTTSINRRSSSVLLAETGSALM